MQQLTHEIYLSRRKQKNINRLTHEAALAFPPISRLQQIRQQQSRLGQQLEERRKMIYQPSRQYKIISEEKRIRELSEGNSFLDRNHFNQDIFLRKYQSTEKGRQRLSMRIEIKKNRKSRASILKLFHKLYIPVIFIIKLKREVAKAFQQKRQFTLNKQMSLKKEIKQFVKTYMQSVFKSDLNEYLRILDMQVEADKNNKPQLDRQGLIMLECLTGKLKNNAMQIPPSFITQLSLLIDQHSFVTVPLLFMPQIKRLSIHPVDHSLHDIGIQQSQMIIACLLGIKCLVWDILYKPYKSYSEQLRQKEYEYAYKYNKQLSKIASIVYYIIMEQFVWELQYIQEGDGKRDNVTNQNQSNLVVPGTEPYPEPLLQKPALKSLQTERIEKKAADSSDQEHSEQLQPQKQEIQSVDCESGEDELIIGQRMNHFNKMNIDYPELMQSIRRNVTQWIREITITILKWNRRNKIKRNRQKKLQGLSSHHQN